MIIIETVISTSSIFLLRLLEAISWQSRIIVGQSGAFGGSSGADRGQFHKEKGISNAFFSSTYLIDIWIRNDNINFSLSLLQNGNNPKNWPHGGSSQSVA